jgi:JmjC domain
MDAIAELADRLPPQSVRRERGHLPVINTDGYVDVGEGAPSATVRDIEHNGFRVSLRDIHQAPEYAHLIHECLDEVDTLVAEREGGMCHRAGYLFISSPAATTPMHFDTEHSFLLQIRGTKEVSVAAFDQEPDILQRERDRYIDGVGCDFTAMKAAAETFRIGAGVGVYLPSYVPHWVQTEAGISVSFSIPFFTTYCRRAETVYRINRRLRKLHLSPRPPGISEQVDSSKVVFARSWEKLIDVRRRRPA